MNFQDADSIAKEEYTDESSSKFASQGGWVLKVEDLCLTFDPGTRDEVQVFEGLNLLVRRNESLAIIGPSGCGKTTLLDVVAGILKPTTGRLNWKDEVSQTGYIFQEYPFLPRKTVAQHIGFPLRMAGEDSRQIKSDVGRWIQRIGLLGYEHKPLETLSVGMKARVALATVMIAKPQLLLLDEPFRALDLETRISMWRYLHDIRIRRECTSVLVSHDLNEAIALADRVIILTSVPSQILSCHEIPFDPSNDVLDILQSDLCSSLHQKLWSELRRAIGTG